MDEEVKHDDAQGADVTADEEATPAAEGADADTASASEEEGEEGAAIGDGEEAA